MSRKNNLTFEQMAKQRVDNRRTIEFQLIGSVLYHGIGKPYLASDVMAIAPPCAFISKAKELAESMQALSQRSEEIDLVSVWKELLHIKSNKPTVTQGELAEYASQASVFISETSILSAAESIAAEWRKDLASEQLQSALNSTRTYGEPVELASSSIREAQEILDADLPSSFDDFNDLLDEYEKDLNKPEARLKPVPTPWKSLTSILRGGVQPSELVVLAARPSVGKTAFALNWAYSTACSGKGVVLFSLEMARQQLLDRLTSNIGCVDVGAFREGLSGKQRVLATQGINNMRGKPLNVVDDTRVTIGEIRRRVRIAQRKYKEVGLVVVDYLQLLTPEDRRIPREQQVAEMSRGLKLLAKDLQVPVLLLAQLNRKSEEANREPVLSDLRESGAIEQDADIVIFLHQARRSWNPDEPIKVIVSKGRSSGVGSEHLIFRRRVQRFEESDERHFRQAEEQEYAQNNHWQHGELGEL